MATLMQLSNEILLHIIEEDVHFEDLEAFSSCNRHLHQLASQRLATHLVRKQRFSIVVIGHVSILIWPSPFWWNTGQVIPWSYNYLTFDFTD